MTAARLTGPPNLPAPPPPAHVTYLPDWTELPPSDQTYGATSDLLYVTPGRRPIYPWSTGDTYMNFGGNQRFETRDANKENVPPGNPGLASGAADGIPATWSNADLPARTRDSLLRERGLSGQPFVRSSSHYTQVDDNEAWEDTQASDTHPNLADLAEHRSDDTSLADISDIESNPRHSLFADQGQPSLRQVQGQTPTFVNKSHRFLFSRPRDKPQDHNARLAERILKDRVLEQEITGKMLPFGEPKVDKKVRREQLNKLEHLRRVDPASVQVAVQKVHKKLQKHLTLPRGARNSFEDVIAKTRGDGRSRTSSERGLLRGSESPFSQYSQYSHRGLEYSPSTNTFVTIRDVPPLPTPKSSNWSPLVSQPQTVMTPNGRGTVTPASTLHTVTREQYEMQSIRRCPGPRRAISTQTGLLPMQLGHGNSSTTSLAIGRALTDAELMDREQKWTMEPRTESGARLQLNLPVNYDPEPALIDAATLRDAAKIKEQKRISAIYFSRTVWCPITALMFGLGYFDGKARARIRQGVTEMSREDKRTALFIALPLGILMYTIVAVIIVIVNVAVHL